MGIALHILGGVLIALAICVHPYPWTTTLVGCIGGYLREQQYIHGKNKMGGMGENSWTLGGSGHKWLEACAWGMGAGGIHLGWWLWTN